MFYSFIKSLNVNGELCKLHNQLVLYSYCTRLVLIMHQYNHCFQALRNCLASLNSDRINFVINAAAVNQVNLVCHKI